MRDRFVETVVEKLILLEQNVGAKVHYRIMNPFVAHFHNSLDLQSAATQIAEFVVSWFSVNWTNRLHK